MFGECLSSRRTGCGLVRIHQPQQRLGLGRGQLAQQVRGVVGVHRLQNVGGALGFELAEQVDLVVVRQFLQDVGEAFVVERQRDLELPLLRQFAQQVRDVGGPQALELLQQLGHALTGQPQRVLRQALHVLPIHDVHRAAAAQPAVGAHRHP